MKTKILDYFKDYSYLVLVSGSLLLLLLFIFVATISGAWPGSDVSAQILSALAGAAVTAMITLFLLLGQTANEEKKERNAKVFEERLRIYNEFLQKLCGVVSDMKITKSEEIELEFQVAQIAMHTSSDSINTISDKVKEIIVGIRNGTKSNGEILQELFGISDTFYSELYACENKVSNIARASTIGNFKFILTPANEIEEQEKTQRQAIISAYNREERLTLSDRAKLLKAMIDVKGARQWIYNRVTLVHDFSRDANVNNNIAVDIAPDNSTQKYYVSIFVRTWDLKEIKKIAKEIWPDKDYQSWPQDEPCRLLCQTISYEDIDKNREEFVEKIEKLLSEIRKYCDQYQLHNKSHRE